MTSEVDSTESKSLLGMTGLMDAILSALPGESNLSDCSPSSPSSIAGPSRTSAEAFPSLRELRELRSDEAEALRTNHGAGFSTSADREILTIRIWPHTEASEEPATSAAAEFNCLLLECEYTPPGKASSSKRPSSGTHKAIYRGKRGGYDPLEGQVSLHLVMAYTEHYPYSTPIIELDNRGALSAADEDTLYDGLLKEAARLAGPEPMLSSLVRMTSEFLTTVSSARHASRWEVLGEGSAADEQNGDEESCSEREEELTWNPERAMWTYDWEAASPSRYVGAVRDIVAQLQEAFNVVNVENVLRADLARAFELTRLHFVDCFAAKHMVDAYTPRRMFHGTHAHNLPNILHRGLLIPGTAPGVMVSNGSTLGNGIYLSPDPQYSVPYSIRHRSCHCRTQGGRMLVCAALIGNPNGGGGLSCVVSDDEKEWVFFNASQVLPCYIVHFQLETVENLGYLMVSRGGSLVRIKAEKSSRDLMTSLIKPTP